MSIFAIARLAGFSIAAASLVSSIVFVVRRFALHARGAEERPSGELLSSAEVDSLSDKRMGQDRLSMVCHRLSVMGFLAGALGHLFSALENAPFMAAASLIISLLTFAGFVLGGAALVADLLEFAMEAGGARTRDVQVEAPEIKLAAGAGIGRG